MANAVLEHVNITVSDTSRTAKMLADIFGWKTRWEGDSINDGHSVHVGEDKTYLALYTVGNPEKPKTSNYETLNGLNHIGVLVDDLDAIEAKVIAAGLKPQSHQEYEPGKRFYFYDLDGIEYEVLSYGKPKTCFERFRSAGWMQTVMK